jgi:hypothetical protein
VKAMMAGVQGFSVSPFFRAFVEQMGGLKTAWNNLKLKESFTGLLYVEYEVVLLESYRSN